MRRSLPFLVLALLAQAAHAEQPQLRPNRDVDVVYRAEGAGRPEQRVRWLAAAQTMRIDPPGHGMYVIIDHLARRMSVVREATRSVIDMAAPENVAAALGGGPAGRYTRRGEATVAGLSCTEWQTQDRESRPALVCITGDGVLLRAGTPEQVRVTAISVRYAPQDPALFRVPEGYSHQPAKAGR